MTVRATADADPAVGQELFGTIGCNGCHMIDGVGGSVGPDLSAVGARPSRAPTRWSSTEAYLRASLEGPGDYVVDGYTPDMPPPDRLGITRPDIEHLVAYLLILRGGAV